MPDAPLARIQRAFSETVDPDAYVPRPATESILEALEAWRDASRDAAALTVLIAPPGLGKTLLLRVFEARLVGADDEVRGLYLPYAGMAIEDLSAWVYGLLGRQYLAPGAEIDAPAAIDLLSKLGEAPADPFYLLIDDAESMPLSTARVLAASLPARGSSLRILLAMNDDARAARLLAVLGDQGPQEIRFSVPMNEEETRDYLRARMSWAGVEVGLCDRLIRTSGSRIFALSGGVPRRVHRLAERLLQLEVEGREA
ncbi:MAG: ATP-binding protein, partial [Deltaproteobacteria bacterium]|nr:ATP-binding protein [Deltaproteobacteria bacterium]